MIRAAEKTASKAPPAKSRKRAVASSAVQPKAKLSKEEAKRKNNDDLRTMLNKESQISSNVHVEIEIAERHANRQHAGQFDEGVHDAVIDDGIDDQYENESHAGQSDGELQQEKGSTDGSSQDDDASVAADGEDTFSEDDEGESDEVTELRLTVKKLQNKIKQLNAANIKLQEQKVVSDNHALSLSIKLQQIEDSLNVPQVEFTEEEGIPMTKNEIEALAKVSRSDSDFAGLLAVALIGADKLTRSSRTGSKCRRYARKKLPDGTEAYPACEKLDPNIFNFIWHKVGQKVAKREGPENTVLVQENASRKKVGAYIAFKIQNLKNAAAKRAKRAEDNGDE